MDGRVRQFALGARNLFEPGQYRVGIAGIETIDTIGKPFRVDGAELDLDVSVESFDGGEPLLCQLLPAGKGLRQRGAGNRPIRARADLQRERSGFASGAKLPKGNGRR